MTSFSEMIPASTAAKLLGLSDQTLLNRIHSGELAAINVARRGARRARYLVRRCDLDNFLSARVVTPAGA
jgi:excisionase family DNA binding protein